MHRGIPTFLAPLVMLASVATLQAQVSRPEPTAAEIAQSLRARGGAPGALAVLTQARGDRPRSLLDEIADTLVAIAAGLPGDDSQARETRRQAVKTLAAAGRGKNGIVGVARAVKYPGAEARLMTLVATATDVGIRFMALAAVQMTVERARFVQHLESTARLSNPVAHKAVALLLDESGAVGLVVARALYRDGSVTDERALNLLRKAAANLGW
jgi:hypothetical protein